MDKGTIHNQGRKEQDDTRLHYITEKGMQFEVFNCFFLEFSTLHFWTIIDGKYLKAQRTKLLKADCHMFCIENGHTER